MLPNPEPQILPSHPLLPAKTTNRATAKTESDRMSFMAGPEGTLEGDVGWGDPWRPSPSPEVPPNLFLVLLVCGGSLWGTEHQPESVAGEQA